MKALDLFRGAGGWSVGAHWAGIEDDGVEIMPAANATAEAAGFKTVWQDVWTFPLHLLAQYTIQIASPPCQTFSQAGSGAGRKALDDVLSLVPMVEFHTLASLKKAGEAFGDDRTALVLTPLWFALNAPDETRSLAWEQVPTVLPVWEACAQVLRGEGWHVWTGYVYSEQHGVAQTRKRAVLIASRDHAVTAPGATHSRYYPRSPEKLDPGVLPWISMYEAIEFGLGSRPSPTITGGSSTTGGNEPIFNRKRWSTSDDWHLRRGLVCFYCGEEREPEACWNCDAGPMPVYRNGNQANSARRPASSPAPTVHFGARCNDVRWEHGKDCPCEMEFTATNPRPNSARRTPCQPAPTMASGHEYPRWSAKDVTADGRPRFAQQSDNEPDYSWPQNRPSTVVAGRDLVGAPGATANRFNGSTKSRNDGVRVTVQEAGVLQSFPPNYPWQGKQGDQYLQAGNAVPPLMAYAILMEALYGVL